MGILSDEASLIALYLETFFYGASTIEERTSVKFHYLQQAYSSLCTC